MKFIVTLISFFVAFTLFAADNQGQVGVPSSPLIFRAAFHSGNGSENKANDIDAYALFFDAKGNMVDSVGPQKPRSGEHAVVYSGDINKSGVETIALNLPLVHPNTQMIALLITDNSEHGFNGLQNLDVGLFDSASQKPLASSSPGFHFHEKNFTALCFGVLSRSDNGPWVFYYAPEFGYGKDLYSIVDEAYRSILRFTPLENIQLGMKTTIENPRSALVEKNRKVYIPIDFSNEIYITAGWNVNGKKANKEQVDLDISIHGFPSTGKIKTSAIATVYFGNTTYQSYNLGPIISLDKDNRTGGDEDNSTSAFNKNIFSTFDDEKIEISLKKLEQDNKFSRLFAAITVFNDGAKNESIGFECIENPFMRLLDQFGNQIAFFDLSALPAKKIEKKAGGFTIKKNKKQDDKVFAYLAFEIVRGEYGWYFQMLDHIVPATEGATGMSIQKYLLEFQKEREHAKKK